MLGGGGGMVAGVVAGGLPSSLPVRGEVRGEGIIVSEIHSVEILIAHRICLCLLL